MIKVHGKFRCEMACEGRSFDDKKLTVIGR